MGGGVEVGGGGGGRLIRNLEKHKKIIMIIVMSNFAKKKWGKGLAPHPLHPSGFDAYDISLICNNLSAISHNWAFTCKCCILFFHENVTKNKVPIVC